MSGRFVVDSGDSGAAMLARLRLARHYLGAVVEPIVFVRDNPAYAGDYVVIHYYALVSGRDADGRAWFAVAAEFVDERHTEDRIEIVRAPDLGTLLVEFEKDDWLESDVAGQIAYKALTKMVTEKAAEKLKDKLNRRPAAP